MYYLVKTPSWAKKVYKNRLWEIETDKKELYLTFDDGPHPEHTSFVLNELKKSGAKATFFCIGKNVEAYPEIYETIIEEGHAVGNHSFDHLNGWKTKDSIYLDNIKKAKEYIDSTLYRPPYGQISSFQVNQLMQPPINLKTVMWSVLSGDFDHSTTEESCLQNVVLKTRAGSIIVFHDSEKASKKLRYALPKVLSYFSEKGFIFKRIETRS